MSRAARRIYNRVARLLDRGALRQEQRHRVAFDGPATTALAAHALRRILPVVRRLDRDCRLVFISAPDGTDPDGRSARWELQFDLLRARATVAAVWCLGDADRDARGPGGGTVEVVARPFPPADGMLRQMVEAGDLLYPQLRGMWRQECRRRAALPLAFRDSDRALRELVLQGLDPATMEFSLVAQAPTGAPARWQAQTRSHAYAVAFSD